MIRRVRCLPADLFELPISTGKNLFRREPGQTIVVMPEVILFEVTFEPPTGMRDAVKAARIFWLIFGRFELRFAERVVVADPGLAVVASNAVFSEQIQEGCAIIGEPRS